MTDGERAALADEIRRRYGSAHRFCKATGLPRGTVYQVLSGRYAGDMTRQANRIRSALQRRAASVPTVEGIMQILRKHACARCMVRNSSLCATCLPVFASQAKEIVDLLPMQTEGGCHGDTD